MKTIIAEVAANNQLTLRYVSRPNCLKPKTPGDKANEKLLEYESKTLQKVEDIHRVLKHAYSPYLHRNYVSAEGGLHGCKPSITCMDANNLKIYQEVELWACPIDAPIQYVEMKGSGFEVVRTSYFEATKYVPHLLDIIKKSRRVEKKHKCWGKVQTVKRFTRNAKQKILEAGSVVDEIIGKHKSYELTLTIPGSGVLVYDVVSRYSGWIVDRMARRIRKYEAKGHKILWFFVWEHQKRGALHQHWCIGGENNSHITRRICRELKDLWFQLLEELSVKTGIDLFQKKGSFGTWRYTPDVWQGRFKPIRKSVGAYFSKYCSKNTETSKYNEKRRTYEQRTNANDTKEGGGTRLLSVSPSRYWGCGSRVKNLCSERRVRICFSVSGRKEGDFICSLIKEWCSTLCTVVEEVSRNFKKVDANTHFIYASGYESKTWFKRDNFKNIISMFKRIKADSNRTIDPIGALLSLGDF